LTAQDFSAILMLAGGMPTVLRIGPFRFHFYSDEGQEPAHIHVASSDGECKFWLDPVILAGNRGMKPPQVRQVEALVFQHRDLFMEKYYEYHGR
jgi:hypothetical protein